MSKTKELSKKITVKVDRNLHKKIKVKAVLDDVQIEDLIDELLKKGLEATEK